MDMNAGKTRIDFLLMAERTVDFANPAAGAFIRIDDQQHLKLGGGYTARFLSCQENFRPWQ